jgi:hypothetical protein
VQLEHLAEVGFILDNQNCSAASRGRLRLRPARLQSGRRFVRRKRYLDRKDRALAWTGSDIDGMAQQLGQTLHDRETETDALAALAGLIVELMKLLENCRKLVGRDADAGIPDLDPQFVAAAPATKQD